MMAVLKCTAKEIAIRAAMVNWLGRAEQGVKKEPAIIPGGQLWKGDRWIDHRHPSELYLNRL
jgi:hypothetical protein